MNKYSLQIALAYMSVVIGGGLPPVTRCCSSLPAMALLE